MDSYPKPLRARLALFYQAIERARGEGFTWGQICAALVDGGVFDAEMSPQAIAATWSKTRAAVLAGRLIAGEMPLPGTKPQPAIKQSESRPLPAVPGQQRPLPTVPGTIPDDPDDRLAELAKRGFHFR